MLSQRNVQLYYIEGNHDFHLRTLFDQANIQFLDESVVIPVSPRTPNGDVGKKLFIAHGDLVDQEDSGYLRLRKFFRSHVIRVAANIVPGAFVQKIGDLSSRTLEQKESDLPQNWPLENRDALRTLFRSYAKEKNRQGFDYVILGHCHDLDEMKPFYFNMGYPPVHRQYLIYDEAEDCVKRVNFPGI